MSKAMLKGRSRSEISLKDAISEGQSSGLLTDAVGLFYSPRACDIGQLREDGSVVILKRKKGSWEPDSLSLYPVFEARLFCEAGEMHWLNEPGAEGGRMVLAEETSQNKTDDDEMLLPAFDQINQQYLVWGEYDEQLSQGVPDGWTILSTAQVGALAVPIEQTQKKDFVVVRSREYLITDDDHGNAYVGYERLLNLEWKSKGA